MKIYTRRGDGGETDLFGGERVAKDHLRVEAYGAVDELNASLGVVSAATVHADLREIVQAVQASLFDLGGYLASPDKLRRTSSGVREPSDEDVSALEARVCRPRNFRIAVNFARIGSHRRGPRVRNPAGREPFFAACVSVKVSMFAAAGVIVGRQNRAQRSARHRSTSAKPVEITLDGIRRSAAS